MAEGPREDQWGQREGGRGTDRKATSPSPSYRLEEGRQVPVVKRLGGPLARDAGRGSPGEAPNSQRYPPANTLPFGAWLPTSG